MMASPILTGPFKWKLWFLTLIFGLSLLSSSLNKVRALQIQKGSDFNTQVPPPTSSSHVHHRIEAVKSTGISTSGTNEKKESKSKIKVKAALEDPVGYAAEWEYKGGGLEGVDEPSETKDQKEPSETQSRKIKAGTKMDHVPYPSPSRRLGPGTWLDSNGYWWLFGGQGPTATTTSNQTSIHYLRDLWVYGPPPKTSQATATSGFPSSERDQIPSWRLVYRPESGGESPLSSDSPENVVFPLLCGSDKNGRISLFGGHPKDSSRSSEGMESHNSMFAEESVVWLYDIPSSLRKKMPGRTGKSGCNWSGKQERGCNGTGGLWTSYICCDACLPDGNTTFDFCPQFSREPILWCNQDSLMTFQLTLTTSKSKAQGKQPTSPSSSSSTFVPRNEILVESQARKDAVGDLVETATSKSFLFPLSRISENVTTGKPSESGVNSQGVGQKFNAEERDDRGSIKTVSNGILSKQDTPSAATSSIKQKMKDEMKEKAKEDINTSSSGPKDATVVEVDNRLVLNWWKFDLTSTEWVKMPEVNISKEGVEQIRTGSCRTVTDQQFLYILCPTKSNLLDRSVLLFDPRKNAILSLGTIQLNNAFHDKKVWHLGRSVFHAVSSSDRTVIALAYDKLLDIWVHDHSSNTLYPVQNFWKGSSLEIFQHTRSFYKLAITFPSSSSLTDNNGSKGPSTKDERTLSFYMANPRSKLFTFDDASPEGLFKITILSDRAVFLPSRDAPFLINSTDLGNKSVYSPETVSSPRNGSSESAPTTTSPRFWTANVSSPKPDGTPSAETSLPKVSSRALNQKAGLKEGFTINESSVAEEMTTETVTGLRNLEDLSYMPTKAPGSGTGSPDQFNTNITTRADARPRISDSLLPVMDSQWKSHATQENFNKTNNSESIVELIPGLKKRILGIKRTVSESKIDSPSPQASRSSIISTSNRTSNHSPNTIGSQTGPGSLQVNNETNRKPLSTSSESPANSTGMPRVMEVLNGNSTTRRRGSTDKNAFPYSTEANSDGVNLSASPQVSALRVAVQADSLLRPESLPATLRTKIDQANIWIQPKNSSSTQATTERRRKGEADDENYNLDDRPNLENNYVSHPGNPGSSSSSSSSGPDSSSKDQGLVMTHYNESFVGDLESKPNPLTYGSSEILIDSPNDHIQSIAHEGSSSSYSVILFFVMSLSLFATAFIVLFFKMCVVSVRCPPIHESVLLKEPIHYSVAPDPDELSFHMPIV